MNKYTVNVNNKKYTVEIPENEDINSIKQVLLNGKKINIDVNMDTMCSIVVNNDTHKINGVYDFDGELVKLLIGKDYHNIEVTEHKPIKIDNAKSKTKSSELVVKAPMPGKIISIDVKVGEEILEGQYLIALEAMKMENKIKATRAGKIKNIKVNMGATCNAGDELLTIE